MESNFVGSPVAPKIMVVNREVINKNAVNK